MSISSPMHLCVIPKREIENRNIQPFLDTVAGLKMVCGARALMHSLEIAVHGYDDIPDELYDIQDVRDYFTLLNKEWPYLLFYHNMTTVTLKVIASCIMPNVRAVQTNGMIYADVPFQDAFDFVKSRGVYIARMVDEAKIAESELNGIYTKMLQYFSLM